MTKIGKYELLESLGKGSYGEVYRAHNQLGVVVALKLLRRELVASEKAVADFQREAALAMRLQHINIVAVLDCDQAGGDHFIVMHYLEGQTLEKLLEAGPLEPQRALGILKDIAAGLDYAHGEGVLHRDLKPKNVMLLKKDGRAIIMDFGLARELERSASDTGTGTSGLGRGTAGYMAPEQIRRQALSAQTDLYALGVVAYRLLVGRLPFEGDEIDVLAGHTFTAPPEAHKLNAKLPAGVSTALNKALAKKPEERFESAGALVAALAQAYKPQPAPAPAPRVEAAPPPQPAAQPKTRVREKDGMVEVFIPAGEFLMGAEDGYDDEKPQHKVYLDGYWMDQTPVTNAQFARFLNERGNQQEGGGDWYVERWGKIKQNGKTWVVERGFEQHPVVSVTWFGARAYANWVGAQLPTEAQWEKTARGTDGREYPWGERVPDASLANFNKNIGGTTPVGSYPEGASPYGVLDMAGNVDEWCADWYGEAYYQVSPPRNPTGPTSGEYRVRRGGSWNVVSRDIRPADRGWNNPAYTFDCIGFRCGR